MEVRSFFIDGSAWINTDSLPFCVCGRADFAILMVKGVSKVSVDN